ncbi:hypothetical protein AB6A40_008924 [Gnathostoma spinigerum]|uniref:Glutaredoxin domain-containing protein n=1 Tax=Gnathostoma spinigerum TaxID=75299 RepID=A0ABD6F0K8_9BILA
MDFLRKIFGSDDKHANAMCDAKSYVDSVIKSRKIVIFSKTYCPYCIKAKHALQSYQLKEGSLECVELNKRSDCSEVQAYLKTITGESTVPRVFIGGKFFGGGDDTIAAKRGGLLEQKLKEVDAL